MTELITTAADSDSRECLLKQGLPSLTADKYPMMIYPLYRLMAHYTQTPSIREVQINFCLQNILVRYHAIFSSLFDTERVNWLSNYMSAACKCDCRQNVENVIHFHILTVDIYRLA